MNSDSVSFCRVAAACQRALRTASTRNGRRGVGTTDHCTYTFGLYRQACIDSYGTKTFGLSQSGAGQYAGGMRGGLPPSICIAARAALPYSVGPSSKYT